MTAPTVSWNYVPGLLELMEAGAESPEDVADRDYAVPAVRGKVGAVAQQMWDWLRGFRRGVPLCERAPAWVPLAELWAAPGSTAELTYEVVGQREHRAEISIVPAMGFGGFSRQELARDVVLPADGQGVLYETLIHLTVIPYVNDLTGEELLRVDVDEREETPQFRVRDLVGEFRPLNGATLSVAEIRAAGYTVPQIERRADRATATSLSWSSTTMRSWSIKVKLGVPGLPSTLELGATCQRSEGFRADFELPGRHDYALCARAGEEPVVPLLFVIASE
ncbi:MULTISPECIES: hypothetical protein [unclassified Geodermatophilus]